MKQKTHHQQEDSGVKRGGGPMRLGALLKKEFIQITRDPSSIAIAFLMPLVLLLLFGYGVSLDAENVPVGIVVENPSADTAAFTSAFQATTYFKPFFYSTMHQAREALISHRVRGIIRLKTDFARRLNSRSAAPVQVILNGVDSNTARLVSGYVQGVWQNWMMDMAQAHGKILDFPVEVQNRNWFNSELDSRNFLVPGLIAVIMTLIGAMLTAMVVAREWERGTMEALLVTPVAIRELMLGKLIPYFVMGMGGMILSAIMAVWVFGVPLRGSIWILSISSGLFLLFALGMGLLISITARSQFVAAQIAIIVTFLPAFLLSGFIFDINSMPPVVKGITYLIGARYYVSVLKTLFLAGNIWAVILPNIMALTLMAALLLGLSRLKFHKRLD